MREKSFSHHLTSPTVALLVVAGAIAPAVLPSSAADYPAQPVRILVGFAAGGAPDTLARVVGDKLAQDWGQPIVVDNRTGAQGNIAMAAVARAAADGYTLALMPVGNAAVNPLITRNLPYDPVKDFAPVSEIAMVENVLVISSRSPIRTLQELIALGRSDAAKLSYATPGAGSLAHLAAEMLARAAGFQMDHVPYRGVAPALTDVIRGDVSIMFAQLSTAKPFIDGGQLRPLGIASRERSVVVPNLATIAEAGDMPGFEAVSWYALMAPAHTPELVIRKIHLGVVRALNLPDVRAALMAQGAMPVGNSPAELADVNCDGHRALGESHQGFEYRGPTVANQLLAPRWLDMSPLYLTYLNALDVEALALTDDEILTAVASGLAAQGRRETVIEPRVHLIPDSSVLGHFNVLRGAFRPPINLAGVKVIGDYVDNYKEGLPSELGLLLLMDPLNGAPKAIIDGSRLTEMRTGAVTAIGAKHLARRGSKILGHVGARGTAYWNVRLLDRLFEFDEIRVHSRRPESREAFSARLAQDLGKPVRATEEWRDCVEDADIIVEAARLTEPAPLLKTAWIKKGAFVVAYGTMSAVELSLTDIMDKMVVDDWSQCKAGPFGSLRAHVEAGKLSEATLHAEMGEIVSGRKTGREREDETILFWHRGLSLSDIALGAMMLDKAARLGIGQRLRYA
jgi:alanine dehydrogenase